MGKKVRPKAVISLPRDRACEPSKADAPVAGCQNMRGQNKRNGGAPSQYIGADTLEEGDIISEASKKDRELCRWLR